MDLHRKIKSLDQMMLPPPTDNNTTTNNLFIGSTTELQRMLKDLKDEDIKDVTPKEDPEIWSDFLWWNLSKISEPKIRVKKVDDNRYNQTRW